MNAWQVKPGDGAAGLRRIDATRRAVGPTDVVVKIHSAGLNYRDLMFARGDYLG
ncbi:NAD(P)-dependent alcohol dehydrogenase, partial [Burkholderia contaminans]